MPKNSGMWSLSQQVQVVETGNWDSPPYYRAQVTPSIDFPEVDRYGANIMFIGQAAISGNNGVAVLQNNSTGQIVLNRGLYMSGITLTAGRSFVSSNGEMHIVGSYNGTDAYLVKLSAAGNVMTSRRIYGGPYGGNSFLDVAVDSSGKIHCFGLTAYTGTSTGYYAIFDGISGDLLNQFTHGLSGAGRCVFDPTGAFIYVVGTGLSSGYNFGGFIRINISTNQITLTRTLGQYAYGFNANYGQDIDVDAGGNIYIAMQSSFFGAGLTSGTIAKYSSDGTLQWYVLYRDGSSNLIITSVRSGASDSIYFIGESGTNLVIGKLSSSSGSVIWSRKISGPIQLRADSFVVDDLDNIIVYSSSPTMTTTHTFKLSGDGSGTGTLTVNGNSFTYASTTLTNPDSSQYSFVSGGLGYSFGNGQLTSQSVNITAVSTAFTTTITYL